MSSLNEVLTMIAGQVKADAPELIRYANEDAIGGYHINEALRLWPMGSMWGVEGQIIYALIRFFKPEMIGEIGGWVGASATHMAAAVKANGKGHVISVDNGVGGQPHGYLIPADLRQYITLVNEDGRVWLNHLTPNSIDFLFEDADHSTLLVKELARLALLKLKAGSLYLAHDAAHDFAYVGGGVKVNSTVGQAVRQGLAEAGLLFTPYLAEPSDCGLAVCVMPGVKVDRFSEPKATEESMNNKATEEREQLEGFYVNASFAPQIGNANIESVSEPPSPLQAQEKQSEPLATEDNPIVKVEVKKVRKPRTPKAK